MKAPILLILLAVCQLNCKAQNNFDNAQQGIYKKKGSSVKLELKSDGTYILHNAPVTFTPVIQQC